MNQLERESNTCNRAKRGKPCASKSWLVWVLPLIGRESGARFFNQSHSEVKQNQSKTRITFDTHLKTALTSDLNCLVYEKSIFLVRHNQARRTHQCARKWTSTFACSSRPIIPEQKKGLLIVKFWSDFSKKNPCKFGYSNPSHHGLKCTIIFISLRICHLSTFQS